MSTAEDPHDPRADGGSARGEIRAGTDSADDVVVGEPTTDPVTDDDGRGESSNQRLDRNRQEIRAVRNRAAS